MASVLDKLRCEPTIKAMATELAGVFYEENTRSARFRAAFPTVNDYLMGRWHRSDGTVQRYIPGWQHHVTLARKVLAAMLGQPDSRVSAVMKERIFEALLEDRGRSERFAKKVSQRVERGTERDQQAAEINRKALGWAGPSKPVIALH